MVRPNASHLVCEQGALEKEVAVLVTGCFGSSLIFLIFSVTPLPTFLLSLIWDVRTLSLPGQPEVRVV